MPQNWGEEKYPNTSAKGRFQTFLNKADGVLFRGQRGHFKGFGPIYLA